MDDERKIFVFDFVGCLFILTICTLKALVCKALSVHLVRIRINTPLRPVIAPFQSALWIIVNWKDSRLCNCANCRAC